MRLKRINAAIEESMLAEEGEAAAFAPVTLRSPFDSKTHTVAGGPRAGVPWNKCTMSCLKTRSTRIPVVGISFTSHQLRMFKGEF